MEFAGRPIGFAAAFLDYFRNPTLLGWCGLAVIPIILHFLLKNKPKKLIFPALRLLQLRSKQNIRKLRLRHIWLLLLRIAAIVLLVLAISRPTLPAANYSPNLRETLTFFAILALCAGTYFGLMEYWRRRQIPQHSYAYRRTLMRGGTGVALVLLLLLLVAWPYRNRVLAEIDAPMPNLIQDLPVAGVFLNQV
ncbi:MAG: BatA domain-containing protein, partial [Planctomycetes bacterium]|nr:BatA domain-containing protein [Planctomycetota bacterium]